MIDRLSANFSVQEICQAFDWSRSGFYFSQQRAKNPSNRETENSRLSEEIDHIYKEHKGRYGSPRITMDLKERGFGASQNRVARLMRRLGLKARLKRAFRPKTTCRAKEEIIAPNHLPNHWTPSEINKVWVTDITYIHTAEGWLYLSAIMDLKSRKIVGWALEQHMKTSLIGKTLNQAYACRLPAPGLFLHSDRGSQYTSRNFQSRLKSLKIRPSMSAIGYCYDNAAMESFWSSLKTEALPESGSFATCSEAKRTLFEYIEIYYNRKRRHSSLGYLSPECYEQNLLKLLN
jgi:putative transposase